MSDVLERQRKREIRGSILRTLEIAYGQQPDTVSLASIGHVVRAGGRELEAELQYLIDLGYAAKIANKRDALDDDAPVVYRLTAKGKQVLNGDLEDRSIEL